MLVQSAPRGWLENTCIRINLQLGERHKRAFSFYAVEFSINNYKVFVVLRCSIGSSLSIVTSVSETINFSQVSAFFSVFRKSFVFGESD